MRQFSFCRTELRLVPQRTQTPAQAFPDGVSGFEKSLQRVATKGFPTCVGALLQPLRERTWFFEGKFNRLLLFLLSELGGTTTARLILQPVKLAVLPPSKP